MTPVAIKTKKARIINKTAVVADYNALGAGATTQYIIDQRMYC